jgi:putative transposase
MNKYNPVIHYRRSIRLKEYDYSQSGWCFITICSLYGRSIFGDINKGKIVLNYYGKIVELEWKK